MPYNDSHHVVKTSAQWDERAIEFWVVPRGCLCVELTPEGKTKIKIGEGNKFYSQLPYVNDMSDLENYYTKEEVDNIVKNINLMAIRSTDEYDTKNDLPSIGNKLGDVRFVKSSSPSIKTDPDVYLWNGSRWIYVGYELQDIDLSQYLKKDEFHELFDPVREKVEEMYPKMHTHENKNILDRIEEPYSTAEKEKLAGLENYDDTEIRELIAETGHTHPNKPVLDTITDDSLWSESDRTKFESLHNYDDTGVRNRLTDLESAAHTHSNKNILDQVTAAFTVEDKTKLDSLHNNDVFIGTDGMYGGREGLVPAPTIIDAGKFLCADGTWKAAGEIVYDFRGATASEDGTNGLVPAPLAGEQSYYLRGDGTWAKVKQGGDKYKAGDGIYILSDEVISDTFPLEIFAKSSRTSQYVIYGSAAGVGEWDGTNYVLSITVEAEGETTLTTQILYNARLYTGDYVDYSRQIIHHAKEDMRQYITLYNDPTYGTSGTIQGKTGQIAGNYNYNPGVTNYIEVTPGEIYWVKAFPDEYIYFDNSYHCIFDENYNVTRYFAAKGAGAMTIEIQPGEKYARFVGKPSWGMLNPGFLYRMTPYEEPCVLPSIVLYPNKINTIDVANTNKPSEIYIEAVTDEPDDPDDPMSKYTGIIYNEGVLDIAQEHPDSLNKLTVHFRETEKVLTLPEGNKYKSGDGIYILAGDASSTTLPVEIYAKGNKLKQYVLYGGTDPVGDWDSSASKYVIPIKVSAEGMSDISTSVLLDDPIGNGDYIDYANQQFVHTRTNMTFSVRSGEWGRWIHADGTTTGEYTYQDNMAPSDYIAISSEYVYLYYPGNMHGCDQFGIPCYAALYDENKVFVRSILLRSLTEVTIEAQPGEAYLRVSYGYYQGSSYRLTKIGEVVTPIILPPVLIYANKINTIDVMTTNKPAEIYVETAVNSGSEDPMADITGIIYNDGILDVTQENPNALNELTVHFRESDKVITIPEGNTYIAGDGVDIDDNNEISAKLGSGLQFDSNGAIEAIPYTLPIASDDTLGGIIVGDNLSIDQNGVLSADARNTRYISGDGIGITTDDTTYTKLEYLKSTGSQYIMTDIVPEATYKTVVDMKFDALLANPSDGWVFGAHRYNVRVFYRSWGMTEMAFYVGYEWNERIDDSKTTIYNLSSLSYLYDRTTIILNRGASSFGSTTRTADEAISSQPTGGIAFFGQLGDNSVTPYPTHSLRIYDVKIYDSTNELLHQLVPAKRNSDNILGFYDIATDTFYPAGGSAYFETGNEMGPVGGGVETKIVSANIGAGLQFDANGAIEAIPYTLPTASTSTLGGVKVGDGLEINEDGVLSAPGGKTYVAGDGITITDNTSFELSEDTVTNTEYFFDTQITSSVLGRTFTKYNTEPALGAVVYFSSGYTQPYFVGLTADSVKYGTNYDSQISPNPDHPTFEYKGVTWYYSGGAYAMRGDGTDTSGHVQKIPGSYPASTEADLQNIARAIIDAADIITDPTKRISANIGEGLEVDNNNDINVKLGDGLYFDADGAIAASSDNDYTAGEGIDIIGTTRPIDINYIRLDINNSRDNGSGHIIQFRNIRVLDNNGNSLQFSHASSIYGDGSAVEYGQNSRDESPQAMIEGRNKTCCTNFSLTKAPLKITFTLTSEISIANITSFSILTGADYTERDPVSWDIYASNDGMTWYKIQEAHSPDVTTARSTWITDIPFVIPPDAVEILPGVKTITAKLGTGLSFDSNDAIELDNAIRIKLNCNNEPD